MNFTVQNNKAVVEKERNIALVHENYSKIIQSIWYGCNTSKTWKNGLVHFTLKNMICKRP